MGLYLLYIQTANSIHRMLNAIWVFMQFCNLIRNFMRFGFDTYNLERAV